MRTTLKAVITSISSEWVGPPNSSPRLNPSCPISSTCRTSICCSPSNPWMDTSPTVSLRSLPFRHDDTDLTFWSDRTCFLFNSSILRCAVIRHASDLFFFSSLGECVLALKSMIGSMAQQFHTYLSHRGEETGNIRGSMRVRVPAERMGTRERLYGMSIQWNPG